MQDNARQTAIDAQTVLSQFKLTAKRSFKPVELLSIQNNFTKFDKSRDELISEDEMAAMFGVPSAETPRPLIIALLTRLMANLARFPLLHHAYSSGINYYGILNCLCLLNPDRRDKILGSHYEFMKLIFICFALPQTAAATHDDNATFSVAISQERITWANSQVVKSFDGIEVDELFIQGDELLEIIKFLLLINRIKPLENFKDDYDLHQLKQFSSNGLSILRTINGQTEFDIKTKVSFDDFYDTILFNSPGLFQPITRFLEFLLIDTSLNNVNGITGADTTRTADVGGSSILTRGNLAQLSTFLNQNMIYSNIRKLYIGRESGYSMRSFESKVFKWNAPTIMLIEGKRINVNSESNSSRFKSFREQFPMLKDNHLHTKVDKVLYGVYITKPWKVSNKEYFGNEETIIFELSPNQKIFKNVVAVNDGKKPVYFNTNGGGIGVGAVHPTIKNNYKKYNPGNVSIIIDSNLEFCVFRNLGLGGEFRSTNLKEVHDDNYEVCFMIKNIEVWGCGGEKEYKEQLKNWEWEQNEVKRRQAINLKSLAEDRALLEMAGLVGQHQSGGSM